MVSVIIPTFNREKTIRRAIESVLNQTYSDLECIVVDDASTDNTKEIVAGINDQRLKYVFLKSNKGPSFARNYGVNLANGEYVAFHDSDDIWYIDKLEKQIKMFASNTEYNMVYCAYSYQINERKIKIPSDMENIASLQGDIFDTLWVRNRIGTPTVLVKKSAFIDVGGFNEDFRSIEDWEFVLRFAERFKIGYVPEILVEAEYSSTGVNSNINAQVKALIYLLKRYRNKNVSLVNNLSLLFDVIACCKDEKELGMWKKEIVPDLLINEYAFDCLSKMAKEKRKINLTNRVLILLDVEKDINFFLQKYVKEDEKIAVYGAGAFGIKVAQTLKKIGYNIYCLVDRNEVFNNDFVCLRPYEVTDDINTMIVTIDYRDINYVNDSFDKKKNLINIFDILDICHVV